MDPEIQKQMGAMRVMRQQQQNCMAKVQALKQTQKRIELTQKEISTVSFITWREVFPWITTVVNRLVHFQLFFVSSVWVFLLLME